MLKDKRFILVVLLMLFTAIFFWAGSRVPALNEKALMGGDTQVNALGFETVLQVHETDPIFIKTLYTTVNWMETNRKGMTFGIIFGSILMLLVSLIKKKSAQSGFGNTLLGMVIGAPLGVCVNCAAPIAKGLHAGGARVETMLAAMVSSPTLNVIVLTMLVALYPTYIVLIKLGLTFAFILIIIPVACRVMHPQLALSSEAGTALAGDAACPIPVLDAPPDRWLEAARWVVVNALERLWYVIRTTVPLMFLAGFLGSLLITLLPWQSLADLAPKSGSPEAIAAMIGVALVGLSLPVPISFDILVPAILMAAGMPMEYVVTLLFTLGIFSIYPFFIIWGSIGKKMALTFTVILVGFGMAAGSLGEFFFTRNLAQQRQLFYEVFASTDDAKGPTRPASHAPTPAQSDAELLSRLRTRHLPPEPYFSAPGERLEVSSIPFGTQREQRRRGFTRHLGSEFGLDNQASLSVLSFISLTRFRAISTGDVHDDGWMDVLIASDGDLLLYANEGGERFALQPIDVDRVRDVYVVNAALVDLNNDAKLDIYLSSYRNGNYVLYNRDGRFYGDEIELLPNRKDAIMSGATAFGDIDRDGDLDLGIGNFTIGTLSGNWTSDTGMNILLENETNGFRSIPLPGGPGETQSMLFSDINDDDTLDLIVGNDFKPADYYYLGDGKGNLQMLTRDSTFIPHSTWSTMSIASADVDNDILPELYIGQITGFSGNRAIHRRGIEEITCDELGDGEEAKRCAEVMEIQRSIVVGRSKKDPFRCSGLDPRYREDCVAVLLMASAVQWNRDSELCELYPPSWEWFGFVCQHAFREDVVPSDEEIENQILQIRNVNSLLKRNANSDYAEVAEKMGVETAGWTWTAKFADLDNDEWQDLFAVNGEFITSTRESNIFFRNEGGTAFSNATSDFGLESYFATTSYSYVDLDNDGDLDLVVLPVWGPVAVYRNGAGGENAISFEIRDEVGNRFGIGTKIIIHYGPDGSRRQLRELQAGGGFVSYDAPVAHFGLGEFDGVERVEIRWSTGERSEIETDFAAGARYFITRRKPAGEAITRVGGSPASSTAGSDRVSGTGVDTAGAGS